MRTSITGQSQSQGRCVKSPSSGSYLVVVLETWERDEALSGSPPVVPEPMSLAGYKAHFFDLEKDVDRKIAFRTPAGESFVIESKALRFELVGTRLNDANQDMGPLFGERSPKIRTVGDQAWTDVDCIVVLEEGKRAEKKQWRDVITPAEEAEEAVEVRLGDKLEERGAGWYSLRIYDKKLGPPVESLDFRFICALKEIRTLQPFPLPSEDGHRPVCVEFLHEPGCTIQPNNDPASNAQIEHGDDKTILSIPPDPACDKTRWLVGPRGGPSVEVTILVERIWWVVAKEDEAPSEWKDTRFTLSRGDFAATSNKAIWVRVPRPRWVDVLSVGFEQSKSRLFPLKVTEDTVAIPLRDFCDSQEVADRTCEHLLNVWIERDDGPVQGVTAVISAEPPVPVRQESPMLKLNLAMISPPRLASVLAGLRRVTRGPSRVLIKEVSYQHHRGRTAHRAQSMEFVKEALLVIAFSLELRGEEPLQIPRLKNRWRVRARRARDEFPDAMTQLRNRYDELKSGRTHQTGPMRITRDRRNESH